MIMTIHQPEYIPWMGFFNKLSYAKKYIALDNVQYRHKYFQNRNRIVTQNGECWLNVPVLRKGKRYSQIKDIEINNLVKWKEKSWKTLYFSYKKTPYFKKYAEYFEKIYSEEWTNLVDLNLNIIENICNFLDFDIEIERASKLNLNSCGPELIFDICKNYNPDVYISGQSGIAGKGKDTSGFFEKENIKVLYQNYKQSKYDTLFKDFIPNMSIIDLLFNHGKDSIKILKDDGGWFYGNP